MLSALTINNKINTKLPYANIELSLYAFSKFRKNNAQAKQRNATAKHTRAIK